MSSLLRADAAPASLPDAKGRFGAFGGRYVPETLVPRSIDCRPASSGICTSPSFKPSSTRS